VYNHEVEEDFLELYYEPDADKSSLYVALWSEYDVNWKPIDTTMDQRSIFAICSEEVYYAANHKDFALAFVPACHLKGGGHYQERLDVFRSIKDEYTDGLTGEGSCGYHVYDSKKLL